MVPNRNHFIFRLLGLPAIINSTNCLKRDEVIVNQSLPWPYYIYPLLVFILYWVLAIDNRLKYRQVIKCRADTKGIPLN